jgi:2-iminobutanoate/2-iminopropanoate deaminase
MTAPTGPVLPTPDGAYAHAFAVPPGARVVYVSGQVPVATDGTVPETFEAQCRQVWTNIERALIAAELALSDIVKVTTFLSDRAYRADNARVRREVLGALSPALTIIIADIYAPEWLLEIEVIAARAG